MYLRGDGVKFVEVICKWHLKFKSLTPFPLAVAHHADKALGPVYENILYGP